MVGLAGNQQAPPEDGADPGRDQALWVDNTSSDREINGLSKPQSADRSGGARCYKQDFMVPFFLAVLGALRVFFHSRSDTALEILALRQPLAGLQRQRPRPAWHAAARWFWTTLRCMWSRWAKVLLMVKPETVVGWASRRLAALLALAVVAARRQTEDHPGTEGWERTSGPGESRLGRIALKFTRLHRADGDVPRAVWLLGHPAPASQDSRLQRNPTSDCGMDGPIRVTIPAGSRTISPCLDLLLLML